MSVNDELDALLEAAEFVIAHAPDWYLAQVEPSPYQLRNQVYELKNYFETMRESNER